MMEKCVKLLTIAERYELVAEIYRLLLPIYERRRHFQVTTNTFLYENIFYTCSLLLLDTPLNTLTSGRIYSPI